MKTALLIFIFALLFAACNRASEKHNDMPTLDIAQDDAQSPAKSAQKNEGDKAKSVHPRKSINEEPARMNPDWDKKIIKTAYLKLEVQNFKSYNNIVHNAVKQYGGYVASEEQNQSEDKIETILSVKVPVDQFESIMNDLPSGAFKVVEKKITSEDVSTDMVDTKSRLAAKEQMRLKYLDFLKESKNMEDVLKVQNEINNIQEQIESASARLNYLSHQSAYSTVNITFYQPLAGYVPADDNPGFLARMIKAFESGFLFVGEIFIGIISVWPLLLLIIVAWMFWKRRSPLVATKEKV